MFLCTIRRLELDCQCLSSFADSYCQSKSGSAAHSRQIWCHWFDWQGVVFCEGSWCCSSMPATCAEQGGRCHTQEAIRLPAKVVERTRWGRVKPWEGTTPIFQGLRSSLFHIHAVPAFHMEVKCLQDSSIMIPSCILLNTDFQRQYSLYYSVFLYINGFFNDPLVGLHIFNWISRNFEKCISRSR